MIKKIVFLIPFLFFALCSLGQTVNVQNVSVSGRFNSCSGANTPTVTLSLVGGSGISIQNGNLACIDPCGTTTLRVNIAGVRWNQSPGAEWLHGLFFPVNAGYTLSGINLPPGFITYNTGCTGQCPAGTPAGPGFYFDGTGGNACCGTVLPNDNMPCNNFGDVSLNCSTPFSFFFDLTFCNTQLTGTSETFTLTGTSDGATGCWSNNNAIQGAISFTVNTTPCQPVISAPFTFGQVQRSCSGANVPNYSVDVMGGCGNNTTISWWTDSIGGTMLGTGSPFNYSPSGSSCPVGDTIYASCCTLGSTSCITRTPVIISGVCDSMQFSGVYLPAFTCNGLGTIDSTKVINSNGAVSFTLMPGNVTNPTGTFLNLAAGSYTITAADAGGCTISTSVTISPTPVVLITNISSTAASCVPGNDGAIIVTAAGGTPGYQYNVGGANQGSNTFSNLGSGIYTVTVIDANGCTATTSVNIAPPNAPTISNISMTSVSCNGGSNGNLQVTGGGGTAPLSYNLMPGNVNNTTGLFTSLSSGAYVITVTDGVNCTVSTTTSVAQPAQLAWGVNTTVNVSCNGGTDGSIQMSLTGGTAPATYLLNPGNISNSTALFANLGPNTYTITATDANNCSTSTTITITQPPIIQWNASTTVNPSCNTSADGSISITASGGSNSISYNLQPGNINNTTGAFTGLVQGSYTITATDANNCTVSTVVTITAPVVLGITNLNVSAPTCIPGNDGIINVLASGGTPAYLYNIGGPNQSSGLFSNLTNGTYIVTATDANGCTVTTVINLMPQNAPAISSATTTGVSCNGGSNGSMQINLTGGTAPFTYNLMPGNITNGTGAFTNLSANTYAVTVTDAVGCTTMSNISINTPAALVWGPPNITNVSCNGAGDGSVQMSLSGGTPPATYVLNPGNISNATALFTNLVPNTYNISVTDGNNCTLSTSVLISQPAVLLWGTTQTTNVSCNGGSDGTISLGTTGGTNPKNYNLQPGNINSTTGNFTGLMAGSYTVIASDGNNCTLSSVVTITQPTLLQMGNVAILAPSCVPGNDGGVTITASGGAPPYQYNIGGGNQASNSFSNLASGMYTITVIDANNCTVTTTVNVAPANAPSITNVVGSNVSCYGVATGSLVVSTSGGTAPLSYNLMPGNITNATGSFSGLLANSYVITVTDANSCTVTTTSVISEPLQLLWGSPTVNNASCNGGADGSVQMSLSGGTAPATYVLNPGNISNTTGNFISLSANSYTVTATDGNNCTISTIVVINQPPAIQWGTAAIVGVGCNGGNNGGLSITASGGTGTLSYILMPGNLSSSNGSFTGLIQGVYTITATDANNCTISTSVIVNQPTALQISNVAIVSPSCTPGNDGIVTITVTGGVPGYLYNLAGGPNQTSNVFNNVGVGQYAVNITDSNGCKTALLITVVPPNAPTITSVVVTGASCNGGADGNVQINASGGVAPLSYNLMPGNVTNVTGYFSNLSANTYTVVVTDANNCTFGSTLIVTEPTPVVWGSISQVAVSCNGGNDGSLQAAASGGTGTITYSINPGTAINTSGTFSNLAQGNYTITATDANSCSITTIVLINQPTVLQWGTPSTTMVSCNGGSDGTLSIVASGGTPALSYNLMPGNVTNNTGAFTGLSQGTYTIQVTDANNCTLNTNVTVAQPTVLQVSGIAIVTPSCVPGNDGVITITAAGGTPAYQYNIGGANQPSNVFNNLGSAIYTITVTDANNCTATSTVNMTAPNAPSITNAQSTNVSCNGGTNGSIQLTAAGGTNPLSYNLMPGNITNATGTFSNLSANNYTVTVTDAIGCTVSTTVMVTEPTQVVWNSVTQINVSCNGGNDGSLQTAASGGTGTITYTINPGTTTNTTGYFSNLAQGSYTITATDANNCSISTTVTIIQPAALQWGTPTINNVSCNGGSNGSVQMILTGGTAPATYVLNPGNISNSTGNFTNLTANAYTITATDANNCTISTIVTITQPTVLQITAAAIVTPSCVLGNDGSITITAAGGTPAYQYNIGGANQPSSVFNNVGGGIYTITVTDANNCTITSTVNVTAPNAPNITNVQSANVSCNGGTNGSIQLTAAGGTNPLSYNLMPGNITNATGTFSNLSANNYTVTVTDAIGCSVSSIIMITEPTQVVWDSVNQINVSCNAGNDGSIQAAASGGTAPIGYVLNPGNVSSTTGSYTNLTQGSYTITATDANNCSISTTVTINQPAALQWGTPTINNVSCNGDSNGSVQMSLTGGTAPATYILNPGNISNATGNFTNLAANAYTITATDANNCTLSSVVTITQPTVLQITAAAIVTPSCVPGNDGSITITAAGGTPAYQYNIGGANQPSNVFNNVGGGIYTITVTDANNCTVTSTVNVVAPNAPSITNVQSTNVSCNGGTNGNIQLTAAGGTNPLSYNLMPGNITNATGTFSNLVANNYTVTVTDAIGCSVSSIIMITEPTQVVWDSVNQINVSCNAGNDGSIQAAASGGTAPIGYILNPGNVSSTTGSYTNLTQGSYTITATDANNCSISTTVMISQPPALQWGALSTTNVSCNGGNDGSIGLGASGGTPALSYNIMPGNITNATGTFATLSQGTYTVLLTDANNCTLSSIVTITEPPVLQISSISTTIPSCVPGNDGSITVVANGGTLTYQYNIGGANQPSNVFNNIGNGVYTITVTDANNCTVTSSVNVLAPNTPVITSVVTTPATCAPGNDGSITVSAANGQLPYQYNIGGANQGSNIFNGVGIGSYTVTVTDAVGCTTTSATSIQNNPSPTIDSITTTEASCIPGCDGTAIINASGGSNPVYTYSINSPTFQSSNTFNNLCANNYTAIVQDGNGCSDTSTFVIITSNAPTLSSVVVDSVNCNGDNDGSIAVTATGGASPLSYNMMPGNITNATGSFLNLVQGNYTVVVTDVNGCSISTALVVSEPLPVQFDSVSGSGSSCNGSSNGAIFVSNVGGTGQFAYSINPAATFTPPGTFSGLIGNTTYTITASDANNCSISTSIFIASPAVLVITGATTTAVTCNGANNGGIQISGAGGTLPYTFNMMPGNVTNNNGTFNGISGGAYSIIVTDANNCSATTSVSVFEPTAILVSTLNAQDVSCFGVGDGSIQIVGTGGIAPLSYTLQPGNQTNATGSYSNLTPANYTVTITDANNCTFVTSVPINEPNLLTIDSFTTVNVSCAGLDDAQITVHSSGGNGGNNYLLQPVSLNNATGIFNGGIIAQQYVVTVTDSNGCSATDSVLITEPQPLTATYTKTDVLCNGANTGVIYTTPQGGTPTYTYTLTPGNIVNTNGTFASLLSGFYTVTVLDANNCSTVITGINITQPTAIQITSLTKEDIACYGDSSGKILASAIGGTGLLQYTISPTGGVQTSTGVFESLYAGNYTVIVTDANNCTLTSLVTLNQNPEIVFDSLIITTPLCHGDDNGTLKFVVSGGIGNLLYSVNSSPFTTKNEYVNLIAGNYLISIMDSLLCRRDSNVVLIEPDPLEFSSVDLQYISCENADDGVAMINTIGGVGYHTYYLRPGIAFNRTGVFSELAKGFYRVKVVDTNQCVLDTSFTIQNNPDQMRSQMLKRNLPCTGVGTEGEAEIVIAGGVPPYTYEWSTNPVQTTSKVYNLRFGIYQVKVTDASGCELSDTTTVDPGDCCSELFLPNSFSPNGDGRNDKFRVLSTAGIQLEQFEVFNRWGQRVWQTNTYYDSWDGSFKGEAANIGTYYYIYRYTCSTDGKEYIKKGDIILVR